MAKARLLSDWAADIGYTDKEPSSIVSVCVYGPTGVGKTHFAGTFPDPFFIDTDRGLRTLKGKHFPFYAVKKGTKAYKQILAILGDLAERNPPFDTIPVRTIVIDSLTELATYLLAESMRYPDDARKEPRNIEDEKPEWDDYSKLASRLDTIVNRCRDLNLNFVATAGRKIDKDEFTGEFLGLPNITGGFRDIVGHKFDEYFYLESTVKDDATVYKAYTAKHKYYEAKSRDGRPRVIINPSYDTLYGGDVIDNTEKGEESEVKTAASREGKKGTGTRATSSSRARTTAKTHRR
jgi:hypothetical protein